MKFHEKECVSLYLSDMKLLEECSTQIQSVQICQHPELGKVLIINDEIQNVEKWAPCYHEAITHIPMMFLEKPQNVLIIGGGDLYAADILLKYPSLKHITICDHDINVIKLTQKYYPHANAVIEDSRVQFVFMDAKQFLKDCNEQFDLIIDDCFNLVEAFNEKDNIFENLKRLLTKNTGVCCSLLYRHIFNQYVMQTTKKRLFEKTKTVLSLTTVPEYPGVLHLLAMWGESKYLSQDMKSSVNEWHKKCLSENILCGELFSPKFCQFYLYLPSYIKELL